MGKKLAEQTVAQKRKKRAVVADKKRVESLVIENEKLALEIEAIKALSKNKSTSAFNIVPVEDSTEAVAVVLASDWHIEEPVKKASVNGLNEYNLQIAEKRVQEFFVNTVTLLEKEQIAVKIDTLVLWLGGDFISNNIHEVLLETNQLSPIEAILLAQNWLENGIRYLLEKTQVKLVIPCSVGNHSRITNKVHINTESGNSLEAYMYHMLARHIQDDRVQFIINESYFTYVDIFGVTLCFHHGHALRYQGGVGGLYVPVRRAIGQWNKKKRVDIWCMGHFHSYLQDPSFMVNGSLIGWNAYADRLSVDFEPPKQTFFLIDKKRKCRTVTIPIMFSV